MCIRKSRFTIALMWAMIPLTVYGSVPRLGCICANGQHKFLCGRYRAVGHDARCVCCYGREISKCETATESSVAAGFLTCCGSKRPQRSEGAAVFVTGRPCRPVLDRPQFITAAKATLDLDLSDHTPLFLEISPLLAVVPDAGFDHVRGGLPPPPDLVTTLGVLLI